MLDLTTINERTYELKWFDGQILHLRVPTQGTFMRIINLEKITDVEQQLEEMMNIVVDIVEDNQEGRKLSDKDKGYLSLHVMQVILEDYMTSFGATLGE